MVKKLRIAESTPKYGQYDYEKFKDQYMYGFGRPENATDDEITDAITYLNKEIRRFRRNNDYKEAARIEKELNWIKNARDIKKKKAKGTYELEQQITDDIWKCVNGQEVDWDTLKEVRVKYKNNISLYRNIEKKILNKYRWFD